LLRGDPVINVREAFSADVDHADRHAGIEKSAHDRGPERSSAARNHRTTGGEA
jgi:hypothetical protein